MPPAGVTCLYRYRLLPRAKGLMACYESFENGFRSRATLGRMRAPLSLGRGVWTVKGLRAPRALEGELS
jgi:hypothetical protein